MGCCHVVYLCTYVHFGENTQLMQHNKINRLYYKWTVKFSVTKINAIHVGVTWKGYHNINKISV